MAKQNLNFGLIICICFLFFLSGCSSISGKHENFIVNTNELAGMMHKSNPQNNRPEMVKLRNGVIVYKDNSINEVPPEYQSFNFPASSNVNFGPKEIKFGPNSKNK